jgi:hypothetical protein
MREQQKRRVRQRAVTTAVRHVRAPDQIDQIQFSAFQQRAHFLAAED